MFNARATSSTGFMVWWLSRRSAPQLEGGDEWIHRIVAFYPEWHVPTAPAMIEVDSVCRPTRAAIRAGGEDDRQDSHDQERDRTMTRDEWFEAS
jgi:hypothetical protein